MIVGLKRGSVSVVPYKKRWPEEFEKEKKRILKVCVDRAVAVEHIGSTSVPGLAAKPIIDIAVGVRRLKDADKLLPCLERLGYSFYRKFQRQRLFVAKGSDDCRTHYLHVMRYNGAKWQTDQLFRNYLQAHPKEIERYATLKEELAKQYPEDRKAYTDGKNSFIREIIVRAKKSRK